MFMEDGLKVRREIPTQIPLGGPTQKLAEQGPAVTSASNAFMIGNLVLNIFLSASLQYLLEMINVQQIILMLPLFALATPANTQIFFGFLMEIASFDMIPIDILYDEFFFDIPDSVNQNLEAEGFGTTLILYNLGSMIIAIVSFPLLVIYFLVVSFFTQFCLGKLKGWCK